jgi:hypothetical protein
MQKKNKKQRFYPTDFILVPFWVSRVGNWVTQIDLSAFTAT